VAVSFIGGGNWSNWRKPPTCHKCKKAMQITVEENH